MPLILKLAQPAPNQGQGSSTNLATSHVEAQLLSRASVSFGGLLGCCAVAQMLTLVAFGQTSSPPVDLVAATNHALASSATVPTFVTVYHNVQPVNDFYFANACAQFNPKNIPPPVGGGTYAPPIPPNFKLTVDGKTFNLSWPFCTTIANLPDRGIGGVAPQVSSVQIIRATPIVYTSPVITELSGQPSMQGQTFVNCSSVATVQSAMLSVALARTVGTTLTNTVTNGGSFSIGAMEKLGDALGITETLTFSSSSTTAKAQMSGTTTTVTKSNTISVTVPPKTALTATLAIYPIQYTQGFSTTVLVDGPFKDYQCSMKKCPRRIDDLYLFPAPPGGKSFTPAAVTFPVRGALRSTDSSEAKTSTYDSTLPDDCTGDNKGVRIVGMRARR